MASGVPADIAPMLGRLRRTLPADGYLYEPKWDGLRCIVFRDGKEIDMRSRSGRRLARYFPELVAAFGGVPQDSFVLDGEIVLVGPGGFDFEALLARIHPAQSRVERLAAEMPAIFVAFDVIAVGDEDLRIEGFAARRMLLEKLCADRPLRIELTRTSDDHALATEWLDRYRGNGIDGVMAKHRDLTYQPGVRAMVKVKRQREARCVAAGFRVYEDTLMPSSLLLGMYDDGRLAHVGVASAFGQRLSASLVEDLRARIVRLDDHPWRTGFGPRRSPLGRLPGAASRWDPQTMRLDWTPLCADLVCDVAYEQVDRRRLRHPARFLRWREDVDASSCTIGQLDAPAPNLTELLS